MKKLGIKEVFINPRQNYSIVSDSDDKITLDDQGNGYVIVDGNKIEQLTKSFMVEGAVKPVWFKKLKEFGIVITPDTEVLEVENVNEIEYSYRQSDGSYTKVPDEEVLTSGKNLFALVDGVIKKLNKRNIKRYTISGINVGSEYYYLKLLGFEQPKKG